MTAAHHNVNLDVFARSDVVNYYADLSYLTAAERQMFETHIHPGSVVLDLGVGGGRTTAHLAGIASKYVGIDFSEEMIRACQVKFPKLKFLVRDAADLSLFANESFDSIVFSFNGLDDVFPSTKREQCLRECYRVLKYGGTFIFSRHNPRSLVVGWDWDWSALRKKARSLAGHDRKLYFGLVLAGLSCAKLGLAVSRASTRSIPRAFLRLTKNTYWRGEGDHFDPTHGGIWTHQAAPRQVIAELNRFQFKFLQMLPEDHPHKPKSWKTRWYYYAFAKP